MVCVPVTGGGGGGGGLSTVQVNTQAMLYHICTMISCGDLAHYRVSHARD